MIILFIIALIIALSFGVYFISKANAKDDSNKEDSTDKSVVNNVEVLNHPDKEEESVLDELKRSLPPNCHEHVVEGFKNFEIKGLAYQELTDEDLGDFAGIAIAQNDNIHDEYAVMIVKYLSKNNFRKMGYTPGGYYSLHEYIERYGVDSTMGKAVLAYGTVWKEDGRFRGRVNVQFDPAHFDKEPPECEEEKIYKSPNLKKYDLHITDKAKEGKFFGYATLGNNNNFMIYNSDNELIGVVDAQEYLYNTVKKFNNGRVDAWGYVSGEDNKYQYHFVYIPGKCSKNKIDKSKEDFKNMVFEFK